jgi:small subunit ribosomal protein S16
MPVKIRLARRGRKQQPIYDIVVADSRSSRDGKFIEKIGLYNPVTNPATITLSEEKALKWIMDGAQPTDTAKAILSYKGILMKKHLQVGVNKGALTQEAADQKYNEWIAAKDAKVQGKVDQLSADKGAKAKAALAAEAKVNQARIDAKLAKMKEEEAALAAQVAAANATEAEAALAEDAAEVEAPAAEGETEAPASAE